MFGYIKTDYPNLFVKDTVLYRAMYCGLCKGIGKTCGQKARLALNYDLTFLSVLLHNITDTDVKIEKQHCVIHWVGKHPIAKVDSLTERIACLNVLLAYHKCNDDVLDNKKGRVKRSFFKSAYKKAKATEPILNEIVEKRYKELLKYETERGDSIDRSADPFGNMIKDVVAELMNGNSTENLDNLSYNLGKWIYLIDALDDFSKDKEKNNYNVFVNAYTDCIDKEQLIIKHGKELNEVFSTVLNEICCSAQKLEYKFNHDLIDNVLIKGLSARTKMIMENEKCKNISKF